MPNKLEIYLKDQINQNGSMDLGTFIEAALSHPDYGYYINNDPFGVDGDFTTAPEISQMFGEVIGAWVIDLWMQMGKPQRFDLIECGPGRGALMADIMRVGAAIEGFISSVQIRFIETSVVLREKQKDKLGKYKVSWHDNISDVAEGNPCIIIGNEFLDALPIEQLKRNENGWQRHVVSVDKDSSLFKFDWVNAGDDFKRYMPNKTESHQIYEIAPVRNRFIIECAEHIKASGGVALFIDYGHVRSHYGDTLQAMKKHEFVNVLEDVGHCDITSHIDFEALSLCVKEEGLSVGNIVTQGRFLISLGIKYRMNILQKNALKTQTTNDYNFIKDDLHRSLERLIATDQMGDLFKVMCFYQGKTLKPAGFE